MGAEMIQLIMLNIKKFISTMWNSCKYYPYLWELFRSNNWNTWKWMLGYIWNDSLLYESLLYSNWKEVDKLIDLSLTAVLLPLQAFLCSKPCPSLPLAMTQTFTGIESQLSSVSKTKDERCREAIPGTGAVLNHGHGCLRFGSLSQHSVAQP